MLNLSIPLSIALVSDMVYIDQYAKSFGDAIFLLAEELNQTEEIKSDFVLLCDILDSNPEYLKLLDTPALSREERIELADKSFSTLNKNLLNLVKILCERRMTYLLFKIRDCYMSDYDIAYGIERVEAITIIPLTNEQTEKLKTKLEKATGKHIIITNTIDPSILGGMKLRYLGKQIDGSVKSKLDRFEQSLKDIVI